MVKKVGQARKNQEVVAGTVEVDVTTTTPPHPEEQPVKLTDPLLLTTPKTYTLPRYLAEWLASEARLESARTNSRITASSHLTEILRVAYEQSKKTGGVDL